MVFEIDVRLGLVLNVIISSVHSVIEIIRIRRIRVELTQVVTVAEHEHCTAYIVIASGRAPSD